MTAYWIGDIPAEALIVEPARNGQAIDLAPFDTAAVTLRDPSGQLVMDHGLTATITDVDDESVVEIDWPNTSVFDDPGIYEIGITLSQTDPVGPQREALTPVRVVSEAHTGWYSLEAARLTWPDAPDGEAGDDEFLFEILDTARQQVTAYAPALEDDAEWVPINYRRAQLMQARNIWNASAVSPDGGLGEGTFVVRPFPLDWQIKQTLRPKVANPAVG